MTKQRLDVAMVARGLAPSREKAQALIMAGEVKVASQRASKPSETVGEEDSIEVASAPPYVSRGGLKLAGALDHFGINPAGRICLDIGSSTGGFTDCLLQRGATRVHAVDVGTNQLDWRIRSHPRVVVHENVNARTLAFDEIGELAGLLVCDVSFISVTLILPAALAMLEQPMGEMVILVKPQFEVGKGLVGKGGIVREPELHQQACRRVEESVQSAGYLTELMQSPILGTEGNKEFLLYGHH
jgi:23S rRNA (cytidine1920-2'-O)/16S rRNA (cytidine1409-2'-O)-methyltransferase